MRLPLIVGILSLAAVLVVGMVVTDFTIYLGDDPTGCNNCHVMDAEYEGWFHGTHGRVATCADCHAPHDNFVVKYLYKGYAGMNDVIHFTLNDIPEPIHAKPLTHFIVQRNCIHCHAEVVSMLADGEENSERYCFECHRTVAHGARGISTLPYQDRGEQGIHYPIEEMKK